ncbi:MAG: signal peptidase I [Rikenellaceae bacterium]|nr:signal peptidase I [Rikenellaceae bacterium]MCL2692403.1 signal peptidase I [Rikenellaceae bacterium]
MSNIENTQDNSKLDKWVKWVRFAVLSVIYLLIFVIWMRSWWMLLGLVLIFDLCITKRTQRLFWNKHRERKRRSKQYRVVSEWVESIVFAVVVVTLIRTLIFAMYVIPTPSMEKSLLVGDYLLVSKIVYGPALPNTPISFPLVHNTMPFSQHRRSYTEWPLWPYKRLKGVGRVQRGDVVVFNFPAGDTVILERPDHSYYDVLRDYRGWDPREAREHLHSKYTVIYRPVDRRENYVKRCVGVPGDVVSIVDSELFVNGEPLDAFPEIQYNYIIRTVGAPISDHRFDELGISQADLQRSRFRSSALMRDNDAGPGSMVYVLPLTRTNVERIERMPNVAFVERERATAAHNIFPHDTLYRWTPDNFGPLWVPRKGETIELNDLTLPLYRDIISRYERNILEERTDGVYINGLRSDNYTFRMDYFFMLGDNRHNSLDSRFWGFVPEDHVVGKSAFIWYSVDKEKGFPRGVRWNRIMRRVR